MENDTATAFAHVSSWLDGFAKAKNLNASALTASVSRLLLNGHDAGTNDAGIKKSRGPYLKRGKQLVAKGGWASMTPAERSEEMRHRQAVTRGEEQPRKKVRKTKRPMGGVA